MCILFFRLGDKIRDNFRQAAVSGAGGLTENLSNPIRASKLAEKFQDLYSQDRMNFIDSLGYDVSEEETDLAIIDCLKVGREEIMCNIKNIFCWARLGIYQQCINAKRLKAK